MAGDYSRESFDEKDRFAAVLMQQGRVQLDADWNEQAAILHARTVKQARETFGRAAASRFGTIDAFRIGAIAGPPRDLSIEPGRYWVEGRLAEAFASDGNPLSYLKQPFLPAPPALPEKGPAIVYLETWEREVTWVEDPALLDVALGGVDTAARLQSVWQVKVTQRQDAACGLDLDAIFPASPARLTTAAVAPPAPEDPCLIAPKTGYRGLENRLYRVEVHVGGTAATARFKWSRDNACIRSPVLGLRKELRNGVEVSVLSVARIGRDPGLRIKAGDWVEITDEHRFLNVEAGAMAQVAEPPLEQPGEEGVQVVLDRVVPTAGSRAFGANATQLAARRTRILRWDQAAPRNALDADGLMTLGTTAVGLEEGVEVTFSLSPANGQFRAGDYWTFAARTADASVEKLTKAPPRGPQRRYAQLAAFSEIGRAEAPSDCRTLWPPLVRGGGEGCCTVIVHPGEDVQAAVDSLGAQGGCVCLKAGTHDLKDTLRLRGRRLSLHAEAPGAAVLRRTGAVPLVAIGDPTGNLGAREVHLAGLVFLLGSLQDEAAEGTGLVEVQVGAEAIAIEDCRFLVQDFAGRLAGLRIAGGEVAVRSCGMERLPIGVVLAEGARDVTVEACAFLATSAEGAKTDPGLMAVWAQACQGALRVLHNASRFYRQGVVLDAPAGDGKGLRTDLALVEGNLIARIAPAEDAFEPGATITGGIGGLTHAQPTLVGAGNEAALAERGAAGRRILSRDMRTALARLATERRSVAGLLAAGGGRETATIGGATATEVSVSGATAEANAAAADDDDDETERLFGIVAAARNCVLRGNWLTWDSPSYGGVLATRGVREVAANVLLFRGSAVVAAPGDTVGGAAAETPVNVYGIMVGLGEAAPNTGARVAGNALQGVLLAVALRGGAMLEVAGNSIVGARVGVVADATEQPRITGNWLRAPETGIFVGQCGQPVVADNNVQASSGVAILLNAAGKEGAGGLHRILDNTLTNCGHALEEAVAIAVLVGPDESTEAATVATGEAVIGGNLVSETGVRLGGGARAPRSVGIYLLAPRASLRDNEVRWDTPQLNEAGRKLMAEEAGRKHRALLARSFHASLPQEGEGASLAVVGNRFRGISADALVELVGDAERGFQSVLFDSNLVEHWGGLETDGGAGSVMMQVPAAAAVAIAGNVVRGPGRLPSFLVQGPKQVAFAGNASTGPLAGTSGAVNVTL